MTARIRSSASILSESKGSARPEIELARSTEEEKQSQIKRLRDFQQRHAAESGPMIEKLEADRDRGRQRLRRAGRRRALLLARSDHVGTLRSRRAVPQEQGVDPKKTRKGRTAKGRNEYPRSKTGGDRLLAGRFSRVPAPHPLCAAPSAAPGTIVSPDQCTAAGEISPAAGWSAPRSPAIGHLARSVRLQHRPAAIAGDGNFINPVNCTRGIVMVYLVPSEFVTKMVDGGIQDLHGHLGMC